jgi:hypothetical protein
VWRPINLSSADKAGVLLLDVIDYSDHETLVSKPFSLLGEALKLGLKVGTGNTTQPRVTAKVSLPFLVTRIPTTLNCLVAELASKNSSAKLHPARNA